MVHRAGFVGRMGPPLRRRGVTIFDAENMSALPSYLTFTRASSAQDFTDPSLTFGTNVPVLTPNGWLMQGARTNLLLNSATLSTQSVTVTAAAHTLSFYGTGTVTLSGASTAGPLVGTGASNRVTLTFTPSAGSLTLTVTGSVTNAQLELGSFASSYIPTTGATATRAADVATISNLASIGFNPLQGTMLVEFNSFNSSTDVYHIVDFYGSGGSNVNSIRISSQNVTGNRFIRGVVLSSSTAIVAANTSNSFATGTNVKTAFAYKTEDYGFGHSGGAVTNTTAAGTLPTLTEARFGANSGGIANTFMFGYIRRLTYFPTRLSDAQLQALTAV
jgi:hypothetical protein